MLHHINIFFYIFSYYFTQTVLFFNVYNLMLKTHNLWCFDLKMQYKHLSTVNYTSE